MRKIIIYTSILVFVFASLGIAVTIDPALVKERLKGNPALFATVQKVMKEGKETEVAVFNEEGICFCAACLDEILSCYGNLGIDPAIVKSEKFPKSFATVGKEMKEGKEVEVVQFSHTGTIYSPDLMHEILTAYGLQLTPEAVNKLPTGYATVVEKEDEKTIVFKKNGGGYNPVAFNQILEAYHE